MPRRPDSAARWEHQTEPVHRKEYPIDTHDYPTAQIRGDELDGTMTLVGESGGLSSIYETEPSSAMPGLVVVTTEHGPLYLDPDQTYPVLALESEAR